MKVWGLLGWGDVGASGGYGGVEGGLTCVGGDCGEMWGLLCARGWVPHPWMCQDCNRYGDTA